MPPLSVRRLPWSRQRAVVASELVVAGAIGVALALAINPAFWPADATPPVALTGSATPEGGVAGGNPSQSPPSPGPTGQQPILAAFDEMVMGAELPSEWRVLGNANLVQVAPFPTAVDRSLSLVSTADGVPTAVCRVMDPAATLISVDLSAVQPDGLAVTLRDARSGLEAGISVESSGSALVQPSGEQMVGPPFDPSQWQRVTFFYDPVAGMRAAIGTPGIVQPFRERVVADAGLAARGTGRGSLHREPAPAERGAVH